MTIKRTLGRVEEPAGPAASAVAEEGIARTPEAASSNTAAPTEIMESSMGASRSANRRPRNTAANASAIRTAKIIHDHIERLEPNCAATPRSRTRNAPPKPNSRPETTHGLLRSPARWCHVSEHAAAICSANKG